MSSQDQSQEYLRALGEVIGNALIPVLVFATPLALLAKKKRRKPIPVVVVGVEREYEDEEGGEEEYGESSEELAGNLIAQLPGLM